MSRTVTLLQGNLFQLAAQYLQDATQWVRIAQINAIADPWIASPVPVTVLIPDIDPAAGGGLGAQ